MCVYAEKRERVCSQMLENKCFVNGTKLASGFSVIHVVVLTEAHSRANETLQIDSHTFTGLMRDCWQEEPFVML